MKIKKKSLIFEAKNCVNTNQKIMGFLDELGGLLKDIGNDIVKSPDVHRNNGYADGLAGRPRIMYNLGRDDGSNSWHTQKKCEDAYNAGYNDGRNERNRG